MTDAEWIQQEREHEYKMASLKEDVNRRRREHLTERITNITTGATIALVVGFVAALIFFWQQDAGERGQQAELACVDSGGSWASVGGGASTCVRVSQP